MLKITGTFLDEISYDIPSHNWGEKEWNRDFTAMKAIGIDTVIMIRCGLRNEMTYDSEVLRRYASGMKPYRDLVEMFLLLAEKHGMKFYFGTFDTGLEPEDRDHAWELDVNKKVVEEAWRRYGSSPAFRGWYLSTETGGHNGIAQGYAELGRHCKELSGGLPVLVSPFIQKAETGLAAGPEADAAALELHRQAWSRIFSSISGAVDHIAFQDGTVSIPDLPGYLAINVELAKEHHIECWTNCETFDRDMPIHFLPIKWDKMYRKLEAAREAGIDKAITFEFSHFMSPNSSYHSAHGLFDRYCEYAGLRA